MKPNTINNKTFWLLSAIVLIVSLFFRISMVNNSEVKQPVRADAAQYYQYAYNLKQHGIYSRQRIRTDDDGSYLVPDRYRPPGYSLFILPFAEYPPTDEMNNKIVILQAVISTFTVYLSFILFRSFMSSAWAFTASILVALSPHLVTVNIYMLTETIFTFFLVLFAWLFMKFVLHKERKWMFLMGLALGFSLLIRPTLYYIPLFIFPLYFLLFKKQQPLWLFVIFISGVVLVYSPWVIRNAMLGEDAKPSSLARNSIHKGMYPRLLYKDDPASFGNLNRADPGWVERDDMSSVLTEIKNRFTEEPWKYTQWYLVGKPLTFLSWSVVTGMGDVFIYPVLKSSYHDSRLFFMTYQFMYFLHWPLIILALLTNILIWLPSAKKLIPAEKLAISRFLSVILLYFILVHAAGTPLPRYAIPIKPLIFGMAIYGVYIIKNSLFQRW
jgi:4-amino-4-deoxy-L-arabinose transferase-like glycosyltransferase